MITDAHCHRRGYDTLLVVEGREHRFLGFHPWQVGDTLPPELDGLRDLLAAEPQVGVGEIGLDRLKTKTVTVPQRQAFELQLDLAAEFHRPVVLHGAKCWGEVVKACQPRQGRIPAFLFHGFSRSTGLLPDIFALNGFVSIGPALLNDHAVNYREMARELPLDRLMVETDQEWSDPEAQREQLAAISAKLAELRGVAVDEIQAACVDNARRLVETLA